MSSWRSQALIEAPLESVWELVGDPNRYPEWAGTVVSITGLAAIAPGQTYRQRTRTPDGEMETTFRIEELDELHEIKLHCVDSGLWTRWLLTEAQQSTFVDVEVGVAADDATDPELRDALNTKSHFRRLTEGSIDGVRAMTES